MVAAALLGLVALVYVLAFGTSAVLDVDRDAAIATASTMTIDVLAERHDLLLTGSLLHVITALSLFALAGALAAQALRRGGRRGLVAACLVVAGCFVSGELLKWALGAAGPLGEASDHAAAESFPSIHTAVAATVALGLALVAPPRWRGAALALGVAYPAAMGLISVMLGWHFPSDVVAGLLFGGAWIAAFPLRAAAGPVTGGAVLRLAVQAGLAGAIIPCLVLVVAAASELGGGSALSGPLLGGIGAIVGTACLTSLVAAARPRTPARRGAG